MGYICYEEYSETGKQETAMLNFSRGVKFQFPQMVLQWVVY